MKINDQHIDRLLRGASRAPATPLEAMSAVQRTRTLAEWRSTRASAEWMDVRRFFRIGLATAGLALIIIAALSVRELCQPEPPGMAMPDSVINFAISR